MKKSLFFILTVLITGIAFAQTGFNYKALITDNGNVLANTPVDIKFTISNSRPLVIWQEEHTGLTTDANGIVVAYIGEGTKIGGVAATFEDVGFSHSYNLKVEVNINGNGYQLLSDSDLKFVPSAYFAKKAGSVDYNNINNIPADLADGDDVDDADHDATNELQNLSLSGNQLSISNGNNVTFNGWDTDASDDVTELNDLSDVQISDNSIFIGSNSGINDDGTANRNLGIGNYSLNENTSGYDNTAIGYQTLYHTTTGLGNIAMGSFVLKNNTTGEKNIGIGVSSLEKNTDGTSNIGLGSHALFNNLNGSSNVAIGRAAGYNSTGSGNVFLGYYAGYSETGDNKLYIANSNTSTPLIYGDFSSSELTVNGSLAVKDGSQGAGKIFTSDANGKGTWQDVSAWDTDASDDFSGDYNDLSNTPDVFRIEGTSNTATSYTDNIQHQGNMIIGSVFSSYGADESSLRIQRRIDNNDDSYGIANVQSGTGNGQHSGISNIISGTGNGGQYGISNFIANTGLGSHYGTYNNLQGTGAGKQYGTSNYISNSGDEKHYGITNELYGSGSGKHYAVYNVLGGSGSGNQYGIYNKINNSNNTYHYGIVNSLSGNGTGIHYGIRNSLSGSGSGAQFAEINFVNNTGDGLHYGSYNSLTGTGSGIKYGVYSRIDEDAGGSHYAVYAEATKDAPDVYAGYFVGDVNVKTGNLNVEDKLTAPISGDADMKAYIYGFITTTGDMIVHSRSSDGFTVSKIATGQYKVTFTETGIARNQYIVVANAYASSSPELLTFQMFDGYFYINSWNLSGNRQDTDLNFVVYKK